MRRHSKIKKRVTAKKTYPKKAIDLRKPKFKKAKKPLPNNNEIKNPKRIVRKTRSKKKKKKKKVPKTYTVYCKNFYVNEVKKNSEN